MADKPEPPSEEKLNEMRETITSLQTELDKVKVELSEMKGGKTIMKPSEAKTEENQAPEPEPEPEPDTEEIVIEHLKKIPGVGAVMAAKIYEAGFTTRAQLNEATAEKFAEVPGIGPSMAARIVESLKRIKEGKEAELTKKEEPPQPEGPGITDKAVDFIKGTVGKIKGFLIKAPPEKKEDKPVSEQPPEQSVEVTGAEGEESEPTEFPAPSKEEVIEAYAKIDGIDTETATKLYEAGYSAMGELKEAEAEDLVLIEGISKEQAENIVKGLKNA